MSAAFRLAGAALLAALLIGPGMAAQAAFPGQNGKLAFRSGGQITVANPDGSASVTLGPGLAPTWSPDGARVAFIDGCCIKTSSADGTGPSTSISATHGRDPAWSPDGQRFAYVRDQPYDDLNEISFPDEIVVVNADGSGATQVTQGTCPPFHAGFIQPCDEITSLAWSPDGSRIAFTRAHWFESFDSEEERYVRGPSHVVFVDPDVPGSEAVMPGSTEMPSMDSVDWEPTGQRLLLSGFRLALVYPDGTGYVELAPEGERAEWSPDGTKLLHQTGFDDSPIFTREVDGSNQAGVLPGVTAGDATWQPLQPPVAPGYPRPKGATPLEARLVVAYRRCLPAMENRSHGPPLGFRSCSPPVQASQLLTVGTADSNGVPAKSAGVVRFDVVPGNPATAADEADLALSVRATDVRAAGSLAGYAGEVGVRFPIRIVDRDNTGPGPGTTVDGEFRFAVPCAPTADTTVGSTCATYTTADAVVPGAIVERRRALWQVGQVQVFDGGPDGDAGTAGDTLFMTQGVFIP